MWAVRAVVSRHLRCNVVAPRLFWSGGGQILEILMQTDPLKNPLLAQRALSSHTAICHHVTQPESHHILKNPRSLSERHGRSRPLSSILSSSQSPPFSALLPPPALEHELRLSSRTMSASTSAASFIEYGHSPSDRSSYTMSLPRPSYLPLPP